MPASPGCWLCPVATVEQMQGNGAKDGGLDHERRQELAHDRSRARAKVQPKGHEWRTT